MEPLTLSIVEIIILLFGAVILGITIHFFISSRRNLKTTSVESQKLAKTLGEWKLKYFNDIELRDKALSAVKQQLLELDEENKINSIEAEEMRKQNKSLQTEIEIFRKTTPPGKKLGYVEQLRQIEDNLMGHNEKINHLLGQIDVLRETEEKQKEILRDNEELSNQISDLRSLIAERELELNNIRQKEYLTKEMASVLDNAHNEFNLLQEKIQKLESQVNSSKVTSMEYEDIKEEHYRMSHDYEEQKLKLNTAVTDNQNLQARLIEAEDKLKESNFQRQQLQKRIAYLEEMNTDLQAISDANKKLESRIKRIGELESMLNVISEERDHLMQRKTDE